MWFSECTAHQDSWLWLAARSHRGVRGGDGKPITDSPPRQVHPALAPAGMGTCDSTACSAPSHGGGEWEAEWLLSSSCVVTENPLTPNQTRGSSGFPALAPGKAFACLKVISSPKGSLPFRSERFPEVFRQTGLLSKT